MKFKICLYFLTVFQTIISIGQTQISTDTSVIVIPHWKKGEIHNVKFTNTTIDIEKGKEIKYPTTFNASFTVLEKDSSGYVIQWLYTKCNLASNDVSVENQILTGLLNTNLICKLTITGRFKELLNLNDVKIATDKVIGNLMERNTNNPTMYVQYNGAKQIAATKLGLETILLKQVKLYHFSFGFKYRLNYVQENKMKIVNTFGGQPFDAIEKVQLSKLDNVNTVCVIQTQKTVDTEVLKSQLVEYLKKLAVQSGQKEDINYDNEKLEYKESTTQQIQFKLGLLQKGSFTRVLNLGIQHRTTIIDIELIN